MEKTNFISHRDWERMAARLEASYDATLDFYVMLQIVWEKVIPVQESR